MNNDDGKFNILLISIHGLIRGQDLELGRDADTGGQIKYVVELLRALGERAEVGRADLLTRRIVDPNISEDYAEATEQLSDNTRIIRIDCGEEGYLPKEALWDSLDNFADNARDYINSQGRLPDIIHSHYADAGYVGGSMGSRGGQNMIEPAAYGAAVSFGPQTRNFRDVVRLMRQGQTVAALAPLVHHEGTLPKLKLAGENWPLRLTGDGLTVVLDLAPTGELRVRIESGPRLMLSTRINTICPPSSTGIGSRFRMPRLMLMKSSRFRKESHPR